jgi:RNA polymerase sigma-70 factor (ECF subfamily)
MNASKPAASGQVGEADERLLIEAAQREPARFAELYELHFERVYAYIARRVRDRDLAEDLSAEVFHKALANLSRFKWRGAPFAAWLFRIAANLIADRAKRTARESELSEQDDIGESSPVNLEQVEQLALLFRLVGELPSDQGRVISMRFAEEKSIREIATELERSEGAIKQLQFRGLESLRAQLGVMQGEQDG